MTNAKPAAAPKLTSTDASAINIALRSSLVAADRQRDLLAEVRAALADNVDLNEAALQAVGMDLAIVLARKAA